MTGSAPLSAAHVGIEARRTTQSGSVFPAPDAPAAAGAEPAETSCLAWSADPVDRLALVPIVEMLVQASLTAIVDARQLVDPANRIQISREVLIALDAFEGRGERRRRRGEPGSLVGSRFDLPGDALCTTP